MIPIAKPYISEEEISLVADVLRSGNLSDGEWVREFEREFARSIGVKHAVAASSGTTALHAAMLALDIAEGEKVLTTPFSFLASSNAILYTGGRPVFSDIGSDTFNLDPVLVERKLQEDPSIEKILLVHSYGGACDMAAFDR